MDKVTFLIIIWISACASLTGFTAGSVITNFWIMEEGFEEYYESEAEEFAVNIIINPDADIESRIAAGILCGYINGIKVDSYDDLNPLLEAWRDCGFEVDAKDIVKKPLTLNTMDNA